MRAPASTSAVAAALGVVFASACVPRARPRAQGEPAAQSPPWPSVTPERPRSEPTDPSVQRGKATFYGEKFRGRKTASGARFNPDAFTCAHRTLPFGTRVEVRRPDTGQSVRLTVTDRGPFGSAARIVDVSLAAARTLNMTKLGVVDVELRVLSTPR